MSVKMYGSHDAGAASFPNANGSRGPQPLPKSQTESATFDHLPLYEDGLPTDGLLNESVQLAQDHTGHDDIDGH
jgi:hypothetical protein